DLKLPPLPSPEVLVAQAQAAHPAVQRAELTLQIAQLETSKQRAARLPTVRAEGDILRQRTSFPADQTAALTIRLTMPIFDSGEISAKVAVAREQQRQAEIALAEAKRQVREDVLQALLELETAGKDLALARDQLAAACAADKKTDKPADKAVDTTASKPAPALPADVAQLAKPEKPAETPAPAPAPAAASLASLQPTGEFVSPSRSEVSPKEPGRVAA